MTDNTSYRITDFAESERPRERLARLGPKSLSNAELLAILLRVGVKGENAVQVAQRLLNTFDGVLGLHRAECSRPHVQGHEAALVTGGGQPLQ